MNGLFHRYIAKVLGADTTFAIDLAANGACSAMRKHDLSPQETVAAIKRIHTKLEAAA
jgi:hypothetical protein